MHYEIRLEGLLSDEWTERFGDCALVREDGGHTLLTCSIVDQAALFGILRKVRDLGMPLESVSRVADDAREMD
jgi:hypothetical protein